ncbi:phosphoglycolate phosphatase [Sphaerisporangium rufum]|uniref:Phosphoglycolate phosphatase n=1 Tax=Sphaerisporangium rufum TaxID=1381558 RepID=A0A919R1T1_9ACTN|nr:phosphoglycolate phosphatase [Sphaerisporangium rufum]
MDAVLFDMDGLLVDTEKLWFTVETDVMRRLGAGWSIADQEAMVGGSIAATARYMAETSGTGADPAEVAEWMTTGLLDLLAAGFDMMPGAAGLLAAVRAAGVPAGLVTSSSRRIAEAVLDGIGRAHFDVVVTADDVRRFKPDPEPYLRAASTLDAHPGRCVVLEDSPKGVAAATAAGCAVVAVPSVVEVPPGPRRLVVRSLAEVDLAALRRLVLAAA